MNHINKERIKSILLIALLVLSLIQVGILLSYQSHRFPISFLAGIFGNSQVQVSDEMTREELFIPYRLVIANGENSHWTPDRRDQIYKSLWDEAKTYLVEIVKGSISPSSDNQENWGDITSKRGYVFEFKIGILPDLLKWFLGNSSSTVDIPAVYKIMIIPDNSNASLNTIYIYEMNGKVYKYLSWDSTREKSFTEILSVFEEDNQSTYREYTTMHDNNFESKMNVEPDVLYVVTHPVFWTYNTISCSIPGSVKNMDELADTMLGNEKERYEQYNYNDGTIKFSTSANLYEIYPDGILEYKYLSEVDSSVRENVGAALLKAYGFVKKVVSITNKKVDIYLSEIELLQTESYRFSFDYMINGRPVHINSISGDSGVTTLKNAITIKANSKRVLNCQIFIRNFVVSGENSYNDRFIDIMSNSDINYKQVQIKDLGVAYVINTVEDMILEPYMVLENKGTPRLITEKMPGQKGD